MLKQFSLLLLSGIIILSGLMSRLCDFINTSGGRVKKLNTTLYDRRVDVVNIGTVLSRCIVAACVAMTAEPRK